MLTTKRKIQRHHVLAVIPMPERVVEIRRNTLEEQHEVICSRIKGRDIEYKLRSHGEEQEWTHALGDFTFNFSACFYRVKEREPYTVVMFLASNGQPAYAYAPDLPTRHDVGSHGDMMKKLRINRYENRAKTGAYKRIEITVTPED